MVTASSEQTACVPLHPLASRDGTQSATIVQVQLPCSPESDPQPGGGAKSEAQARDPLSPRDGASGLQGPWGLRHQDIAQYPILDDRPALYSMLDEAGNTHVFPIDDAPPIRTMSVEQFASLHAEYASLDVPHSVVFPFLHGVDGSNAQQNSFFHAPLMGQAAPQYRGLTVVRADMPTPRQQQQQQQQRRSQDLYDTATAPVDNIKAQSNSAPASTESHDAASHRDSMSSSAAPSRASSEGSYGSGHRRDCSKGTPSLAASSSSASFASSLASSDQSTASMFWDSAPRSGHGSEEHSNSSRTSITTSHADSYSAEKAVQSPLSAMRPSQASYDPQPDHSLLNSSFYPCELIRPPVLANKKSTTRYLASSAMPLRHGDTLIQTASFYQPMQARGVNLRNFNIQAAKYATVSDIVIYCPAGYHEGVHRMAKWFREAQEANWQDRRDRNLGGLRYNVFVLVDSFAEFEKRVPHLVAVDHAGYSHNRVDFVEREREEMQRLTAASVIDDNVWLGCSADVPSFGDDGQDSGRGDDEWLVESNPNGFSICIQCHDTAEVPNASRLKHASQYLDAVEATTLFETNSKQALRDFDEDDKSRHSSESGVNARASGAQPTLGPSGWTPSLPSRLHMGSIRRKTSNISADAASEPASLQSHDALCGSNIVELECSSLTSILSQHADGSVNTGCTDAESSRIADSVINMCAWIKQQAQPNDLVATQQTQSLSQQSTHGGLLAGALRSVQYHGRSGGGSMSTPGSPQKQRYYASLTSPSTPANKRAARRVLIHCGDGYTETSILALAYMMYARGHTLPEAYLHLQNHAQRSFFVFAKDLPFLKKLEQHILLARSREAEQPDVAPEKPRGKHAFSWLGADDKDAKRRLGSNNRRGSNASSGVEAAQEQSVWSRGLHNLVSAASGGSSPLKKTPSVQGLGVQHSRADAAPSRALTPTPKTVRSHGPAKQGAGPQNRVVQPQKHAWFHDRRFEGSFPSRILPFLYLGNLNHALNPAMLHALGITHVVSVGESALHPPPAPLPGQKDGVSGMLEGELANSLWLEEQAGRISVLDLKNVCDDGIDPLRSTMRQAVEYIESARRTGGKVLVHCRVGVSRSTTIVLAYVMAHLDMSLVESYLMVRSRRLSILIQPHLLFFWELRGWETHLAAQKAKRTAHSGEQNQPTRDRAGINLASLSLEGPPDTHRTHDDAATTNVAHAADSPAAKFGGSDVDVDVDIGAGAGTPYNFQVADVERLPFGSGSPGGIAADSLRLSWGYLCREIAALNERYF
ncbi:unnamed protein product [Parajaminaea phylloscopi]